ncbi:MAG: glycosyltransferase [Bacteroidota bacterium]|nr:glycosyltransferase [Bacteroidota bacterium]
MKILWLASWYPNAYEPANGDFIQRNAKAVAEQFPLDLLHVVQAGAHIKTKASQHYAEEGSLREWLYSFSFRPLKINVLDKIRYNICYYLFYNKILSAYFIQHGKPDLIHVHLPMKAGILARALWKRYGIPYIVSEHASMYDEGAKDHFDKRSYFFRNQTKKIFRDAKVVTNVSAAMAANMKILFGIKQIEIIRNLADTSLFYYQPLSNYCFRWIHVSTMNHQKNIEGILDAFAILKQQRNDWELLLVGPVSDLLRQRIQEKKLEEKIIIAGEVTHEKVAAYMQQSNAMVMFSRNENFPCVMVEAICCGLPVVASKAGGMAEAIDSSNGILVEKEDISGLVQALNKVMDQYENYSRESIAAAASNQYSKEKIAGQIIDLYGQFLA